MSRYVHDKHDKSIDCNINWWLFIQHGERERERRRERKREKERENDRESQ